MNNIRPRSPPHQKMGKKKKKNPRGKEQVPESTSGLYSINVFCHTV